MTGNQSKNIVKIEEVSLENVIRRCGDFHYYQFIHYIFLTLLNISSGITGFYYVFGLAQPSFRCQLPSTIWPNDNQYYFNNITHNDLLNQYGYFKSKCENLNGTKCNSFVYDRSIYGRTFTEEANYICGDAIQKTWLSTAYQIGRFAILITGPAADKIGRRKMIQILTISVFLITVFTQILLQFVNMSVSTEFILLFVNQIASAIESYSIAFLLLMELTSSSHTSFACGLTLIAYTFGEVLLTIFAYISRDWLLLKWIISIYFVILLPYLYFVPESSYWLLSKKEYNELEICLRKIANTNGRSDDEWLPLYNQLIDDTRLTGLITKERKLKKPKYFKHLSRLAISGFIQFATMLLYTKISYGLAKDNHSLNPYWNFIIGAIVEAIGYLIAGLLIITSLGRKYSLIIFASFTSICVLIIPFIMKSNPGVTTLVSQLAKLFVSSAVAVSWIYVPELFPITMRGLANAISIFVGTFGSILAPIIDEALGVKYIKLSFYVYSGLFIILALITCILPETQNRSFDDGEEYDQLLQDKEETTKTGLLLLK